MGGPGQQLLDHARVLNRVRSFEELAEAVVAEVRARTRYKSGWLYVLSDDAAEIELLAVFGTQQELIQQRFARIEVGDDAMLQEILTGSDPVVIEDAVQDPRTNKEIVAELGNRTIINVPLLLEQDRIGAFGTGTFGDEGVMAPTAQELDHLRAMAAQIAVVAARLRAEERGSDLESLFHIVSHDLRAPLRAIVGLTQIVLESDRSQLDDIDAQHLQRAIDAGKRQRDLLDALGEYVRIGRSAPQPASVAVDRLVQDVLADLRADIEDAQAHPEVRLDGLPTITADPDLMRLVFQNLISNALKFRGDEPARVAIHGSAEGDSLQVSVEDRGVGIPEALGDAIFNPFRRGHTYTEYPGTGIGLAIAKRVVELHRGEIHAARLPDAGSIFTVTLPAGRASAA